MKCCGMKVEHTFKVTSVTLNVDTTGGNEVTRDSLMLEKQI